MKKALSIFLFASSLAAQVQLGKNVQIGGNGTGTTLKMKVVPPVPGQSVILYPGGHSSTPPQTGFGTLSVDNNSTAFTQTPSVGQCCAAAGWSGFALPGYVNPANVTAVYAVTIAAYQNTAFNTNNPSVNSRCTDTLGPFFLYNTAGSFRQQQFSTLMTGAIGSDIPSITCDVRIDGAGTVNGGTGAVAVAAIALVVYYTGPPPPPDTAISIISPLQYVTATNSLGVDINYPFPGLDLLATTVSGLPQAQISANTLYLIRDGASSSDCSTGGGSSKVQCFSNGTAWSAFAGSGGAVSSVANSDGTLIVTPTTGSVVASLNLGHANTWTAPISVNDGTGNSGVFQPHIGTDPGGVASTATYTTDSTNGYAEVHEGTGALSRICTVANGLCASGGAALPALVAQPTPTSTTFLQALNNAKNATIEIKLMGDSFVRSCQPQAGLGGGPVTCTNRWAEQLRIKLQGIYGSNGTGVVPVQAGMSGATVTPDNTAWSCSGTMATSSLLGPTQSNGNTLIALSPGASCTFHDTRNIAWDTLNTLCMTNATSVGLAVNIDSGAQTGTACGTTSGSATARLVTLASTSSTSHSVTFTNTAGSGTAYLYGARGVSGTTGVSVSNEAFDGATAALYGASATTEMAFSDLIPHQAMIYQDQTNDAAGGVSTGTFSTNVQNIITHEQALGSSPTVVLAIPPVDVVNGTFAMAPYTAIQAGLCASDALTCINIQNRGTTVGSTAVGWGTTYISSGLWDLTGSAWPTGNAGVHPSDAGSLDEFQMIYAALVNPVCTINCVFNNSITVQQGASSIAQNAIGSTNFAGTNYSVAGMNLISMAGWGTGNSAGLVGVWGPLDNATLKFIWNTNLTDDLCGYTPITAVSSCTGSTWKILHTGDATFTSVGGVPAATMAFNDATSSIQTQLNSKAPLASPALTGTPTAPTATVGTNTTQIATTAFVLANGSSGGSIPYVATTGSVNVMVATFSPAITSLVAGLQIAILPNLANTSTSPSINVNGLGAKTITKYNASSPIAVGDLATSVVAILVYNGTTFNIQNPAAQLAAGASGSTATPALSFISNPDYGLSVSSGALRASAGGNDVADFNAGGLTIPGFGSIHTPDIFVNSLAANNCVQTGGSLQLTTSPGGPCAFTLNGGIASAAAQTTVSCSTSGNVIFSQPAQGSSYKQVMIYANACLGTASYTYPTAFAHTPQVLSQSSAALATSVSTSAVTITGTTSTGFLELDGF